MSGTVAPPPLFTVNEQGEIHLNDEGRRVLRRGGHDGVTDDTLLMLEIIERAPGMNEGDLRHCFIAAMDQYGSDALKAIRSGHIQFKARN